MRFGKRLFAAAVAAALVSTVFIQKDQITGQLADASRKLIGDENTAQLERVYFDVQDQIDRARYEHFGAPDSPYSADIVLTITPTPAPAMVYARTIEDLAPQYPLELEPPIAEPPPAIPAGPAPMILPETRTIFSKPTSGEGVWVADGLPRTSAEDPLMAKTFIRPDPARPYSTLGVMLLDKRRIRLGMIGGTDQPGGDRGVRGPGVIPANDVSNLLAAWNGGFQGPHGGYGMYADGKLYRPLINGFASVALARDGTISMGEWGRSLTWSDDFVAVRQNAVLLVDNGEITRQARDQGQNNNIWGYVQVSSSEFITWRSAIGLTENGDLLVAAGNSLSAYTLARGLQAAGAKTAMQLDINTPYVLISLFFPESGGRLRATRLMDTMVDKNAARFLSKNARDFMYVVLDETNFK